MPENYSDAMFRHCVNEVIRLGSQDFFKADDVLVADLAKALAHCADTEDHATRMVSTWKASTRAMLHESDLVELADRTEIRGELPSGCGRCLGTDFIIIEKNGYSGAKRCSCARGRGLAKMDKPTDPPARTFDFSAYFAQADDPVETEPEAKPEPARKRTTRPPQIITPEEVDQLRAAELERRRKREVQ
jgi:hypothetical protein